jgi:hypothetical protein
VRELLIPLGSILASATAIIQVQRTLPEWFLAIAAGFYVVTIGAVAWSLWPSFTRVLENTRRANRHRAAVHGSLPDFLRLVRRFDEYMDVNRGDKLPYMLRNLNMTQFSGKLGQHGPADYHLLSGFLRAFNRRLAQFRGDVSQFVVLMKEFQEMVQAFHELYVTEPYGRLKEVIFSEPPESLSPARRAQIIAGVEIGREDYVRFAADYEEFTEHVNSQLGERVLSPYLPPIERLVG